MRVPVVLAALLLCLPQSGLAQADKPDWMADSRTGCRVWNAAPKPNETVAWSGNCQSGMAQGTGVLRVFRDGKPFAIFDGELRDGKLSGQGVITWANGDRYDGEWRDDKKSGRGVKTWANGDRYDGEWRDDKKSGRGVYIWANGDRYDGEWRDDVADGVGVAVNSAGTFNGIWTHGCFKDGDRIAWIGQRSACP